LVSCASAGNCAAGGFYTDSHSHQQGFVVAERGGVWGQAIEVPGLAALNTGGWAAVNVVSCASAGNCSAGGYYTGARSQQAFVADERNGVWTAAIAVPGLAALNTGGQAEVSAVSCGSAGNCVAGGYYSSGQIAERGFAVIERNGVWGTAIEVPGLAALDKDRYSGVISLSCGKAGACGIGGYYTYHGGDQAPFAASERNGVWTAAIAVPGLAALNTGGGAGVSSVSCPSAGNCAAGGSYTDRRGNDQAFVVTERNGRWGTAIAVPGPGGLSTREDASISSVSCASAGNCAAGGLYALASTPKHPQGFVLTERKGRWGAAIGVPGLAALNKGMDAHVLAVSCASAGNCGVGGYYFDRPRHYEWFVAVERNGRWGTAAPVPGFAALNKRTDGVDIAGYFSVSCAPDGACAAGGYYLDSSGASQGYVTQTR
jgi:hypothetical protein